VPSAVLYRELLLLKDAMASRVSGSREGYHVWVGDVAPEAAAGGGKAPETCQLLPREPESTHCFQSHGADILGMSMTLTTLRHLSEPFLDGLASFPKGCFPPSLSAGSRQAGS